MAFLPPPARITPVQQRCEHQLCYTRRTVTATSSSSGRVRPDLDKSAVRQEQDQASRPTFQFNFDGFLPEDDYEREQALLAARTSRRFMLRALGVFTAMSLAAHMGATELGVSAEVAAIRTARKRLDDVDDMITAARWDGVRTLLASPTLRQGQDAVKQLSSVASADMRGAWIGLREDVLSASRLLDTAVYSNVFVGEDRKVLGTAVDYDTPRLYLVQLKEAYDQLAELAENS